MIIILELTNTGDPPKPGGLNSLKILKNISGGALRAMRGHYHGSQITVHF